MGVMDNLTSTLTGNIEKAIIRIADDRMPGKLVKRAAVAANGAGGGAIKDFSAPSKLNSLERYSSMQARSKSLGKQMEGLRSDTASFNALAEEQKLLGDAMKADEANPVFDKAFVVQFNPSSLTLTSYASDDDVEIQDYGADKGQIKRGKVELHIDLGVQLIFDRLVNSQAFTEDLLNYSPSDLLKKGVEAGARNLTDRYEGADLSVQVMVEGFTAALRNERTRRICFEWGSLRYTGVLRNVNANYTMFDRQGRPVRATCSLKLYLRDYNITASDQGYWEYAYDRAFRGDGLITTKRAGQAVGSFLGGLG